EVDRHHRLDAGGPRPGHELVQAEPVGLDLPPRQVEPGGPLGDRADAVLPAVAGDEVAARIPYDAHPQLAGQLQHVGAEAVLVGGRVAGFEGPGGDAAAHVLDERAEQAPADRADGEVTVQGQTCGLHV